MQNNIKKLIDAEKKIVYNVQSSLFYHLIGNRIFLGTFEWDSILYDVTKWTKITKDGFIKPKKGYKNKNLTDTIRECKSIRIKPAIYLVKLS